MTLPVSYPMFGSAEDLFLGILRPLEDNVPNLKVRAGIQNGDYTADGFTTPYLLVHQDATAYASEQFGGDHRYVRRAAVTVQSFAEDGDDGEGQARCEALQEIALQALMTAHRNQVVVPGVGVISKFVATSPYHPTADWATGSNVVRFANLPKGMYRYEATYGLLYRPDVRSAPNLLAHFQ